MPPRINLLRPRSLAFRTKSLVPQKRLAAPVYQNRFASDDASDKPKGPNQGQAAHVSEEQAAIDKIMGETPPDMEQGTPVLEILERDPEAQAKAPEVLKKQMKESSQKRSYSTTARKASMETELTSLVESISRLNQSTSESTSLLQESTSILEELEELTSLVEESTSLLQGTTSLLRKSTPTSIRMEYPDGGPGHKFPLPDVGSIPRSDHLKRRYDLVVDQVTKSLMRDGKLTQAQRNMSTILNILRTAPPPQPNPQFPTRSLLTTQPRSSLPLNPIQYLTTAIDSVAPLLKIRQQRGVSGGGASLPLPVPLRLRQRRRVAIQWILSGADNRREINLADRVAREIINVAEGKSSAWEKRAQIHKLAVSARSNIRTMMIANNRSRKF